MDQLILRAGIGLCIVATLTACGTEGGPVATHSPDPTGGVVPTGSPSTSPTSSPSILEPSYPESETLIASLASQRGINEIGPYPVTGARISVYVRCIGPGAVDVDVVGVATFSNACTEDPGDLGTQNTVDVRFVDQVIVRVAGDDRLVWALAVTQSG